MYCFYFLKSTAPVWEEGGHGQGVRERPCHAATRACSLNSPSAQNCNWREQAITLTTPGRNTDPDAHKPGQCIMKKRPRFRRSRL